MLNKKDEINSRKGNPLSKIYVGKGRKVLTNRELDGM